MHAFKQVEKIKVATNETFEKILETFNLNSNFNLMTKTLRRDKGRIHTFYSHKLKHRDFKLTKCTVSEMKDI